MLGSICIIESMNIDAESTVKGVKGARLMKTGRDVIRGQKNRNILGKKNYVA
jgi:hypothetical protein